jgi:hypothetical protein
MSHKTISINPNLFSIGKTKKNREKKEKKPRDKKTPLISPNVLKNKLLNRIKEHKQKELQKSEEQRKQKPDATANPPNFSLKPELASGGGNTETSSNNEADSFTDEFNDSIQYLQTLSQKKSNDKKQQQMKEELERKTVKNFQSMNAVPDAAIHLDLPEELKDPPITTTPSHPVMTIKPSPYNVNDTVPYGVLKNGLKPTYRNWTKTQRNMNTATVTAVSPQLAATDRESRLQNLREKLKKKERELEQQKQLTQTQIQPSQQPQPQPQPLTQIQPSQQLQPLPLTHSQETPLTQIQPQETNERIIATKKITKRIIKKNYTLGKSKIKNTVGVLIKDKGTRKKVIDAQRDIKKKNINDIKLYLKEHNLIKAGSRAPNDVFRKMYESSMLSGDVTNTNTETLLHNFSKSDGDL